MSMQVWIAMVVGMAAVIDDLARRHIANWIPAADGIRRSLARLISLTRMT